MEDKKTKKSDKRYEQGEAGGYYSNQPKIERNGMSKIRQQFNRGMSAFLVVAAAIIFYFALLYGLLLILLTYRVRSFL